MNQLTFNILTLPIEGRQWYRRRLLYLLSLLVALNGWMAHTLRASAQPSPQRQSIEIKAQSAVAVSLPNYPLKEGVHLFGRARVPAQLQTEYLVFRMTRNRVVGAFFMPSSSFDCFSGTMDASKLTLTVVESYEQQTYDHSINLNQYYPIPSISDNDLRILDVCATPSSHTAQEP
ncbi:hypothetical protein [Acaryochloris sp. IP29b_bin.148]|uniref:hypothetical protein n=1 Tax=Acaryochloris sp. IP29b_bin.148 TaxID=2969218 RepID=UPI002604ADD4|nr:hypothetical protein [Acaryochloris sp. IP29b_bin.148]